MFGQYGKVFFLTLMVLSLLTPLISMFWAPQFGAIAFLIGLAIGIRCLGLVRTIHLEGSVQDQQVLHAKQNRAQTIFVQLVDEDGNDLAPEVAQSKLAAAHLAAGPRDMVIGVRHKIP